MPIYEYRCTACGHELETLQRLSDPPLTQCPACEQESLSKKVSAAAFRLKGGGWYETDFKSKDRKNLAGEGGSGDTKSETKSETKSDTPAAGESKAAKPAEAAKPVKESPKAPASKTEAT